MISKYRERVDKPHIFFREGYWRVSLSTGNKPPRLKPWQKAHQVIFNWNRLGSSYLRLRYPFQLASAGIGLEPGCECSSIDYCDSCLEKMSKPCQCGPHENCPDCYGW